MLQDDGGASVSILQGFFITFDSSKSNDFTNSLLNRFYVLTPVGGMG